MHSGHAEAPARPGRPTCPTTGAVLWWALALVAVTTVGLGALTWALVTTHALAYGGVTILGVDVGISPVDFVLSL